MDRKRGQAGKQKPNNPLSLIPTHRSFAKRPGEQRRIMLVGGGDIKATDFLTSLRAWGCPPSTSASRSQGWDGEGRGGLEEGALPSPLIKFRLPLPLSQLRERPGDSKNGRE